MVNRRKWSSFLFLHHHHHHQQQQQDEETSNNNNNNNNNSIMMMKKNVDKPRRKKSKLRLAIVIVLWCCIALSITTARSSSLSSSLSSSSSSLSDATTRQTIRNNNNDITNDDNHHQHKDKKAPPQSPPQSPQSTTTTSSSLPRLVLVGPVRDAEPHLPALQDTIVHLWQTTSHLVEWSHLIFVENDSKDDTVRILQSWNAPPLLHNHNSSTTAAIPFPPVLVESTTQERIQQKLQDELRQDTNRPWNASLSRTELLAYARNRLWQLVEQVERQQETKFDYVLSMDMDNVNHGLSNLETCLSLKVEVCCANSYSFYYDLWALRVHNHKEDWILEKDILNEVPKRDRHHYIQHLPASLEPIPVQSCFNGAALYHYRSIQDHLQSTTTTTTTSKPPSISTRLLYKGRGRYPLSSSLSSSTYYDKVCEHVVFHEELRRYMPHARLVIQPKMMNVGNPLEYVVRGRVKARKTIARLEPLLHQSWSNPQLTQYYHHSNKNKNTTIHDHDWITWIPPWLNDTA